MKVLVFVLISIIVIKGSKDFFFDQKLDHFDRLDKTTFSQRYWINNTFHAQGGPILLAFAGEAPLDDFYGVENGLLVDLARENNAVLLYMEHRFYGKSFPDGNPATNNMRFLSTQQAITDGLYFLEYFMEKEGLNANTKVMTFGCSYSGMLSAFFRTQFPHAAVAAVAGSAPVLAQLEFTGYDETISRVLGYECNKAVNIVMEQVDDLVKSGTGRVHLASLFNLCEGINFDHQQLMYQLAGFVMDVVQGNNPDKGFPVNDMCKNLTVDRDQLATFAKYFAPKDECMTVDFITEMYKQGSGRSWWFQKCTEYGYFKTDPSGKIFSKSNDLKWYLGNCAKVFGTELVPNTKWTNAYFGGLDLSGTNILFTNGNLDPWAALGLRKNITASNPVFLYDAAHCAPFHKPTNIDPINLIETRLSIHSFVLTHLKNSN